MQDLKISPEIRYRQNAHLNSNQVEFEKSQGISNLKLPPLPAWARESKQDLPKLPDRPPKLERTNVAPRSTQKSKKIPTSLYVNSFEQIENMMIAIALVLKSYTQEDIESLLCLTSDPLEAALIKKVYNFSQRQMKKNS